MRNIIIASTSTIHGSGYLEYILDDLKQTVEKTIQDQTISDSTNKIVDSVISDIKNSLEEKSKEIINTIKTAKAINNFEEE